MPRPTARQLHATLGTLWLAASIPSMIWWRDSIAYLVFLSVYAIVAAHWSAWQASKAEQASKE